jgi:hypothetical protein
VVCVEVDSGVEELDCVAGASSAVPVELASVELASVELVVGVAVGARSAEVPFEVLEPEVPEPLELLVA